MDESHSQLGEIYFGHLSKSSRTPRPKHHKNVYEILLQPKLGPPYVGQSAQFALPFGLMKVPGRLPSFKSPEQLSAETFGLLDTDQLWGSSEGVLIPDGHGRNVAILSVDAEGQLAAFQPLDGVDQQQAAAALHQMASRSNFFKKAAETLGVQAPPAKASPSPIPIGRKILGESSKGPSLEESPLQCIIRQFRAGKTPSTEELALLPDGALAGKSRELREAVIGTLVRTIAGLNPHAQRHALNAAQLNELLNSAERLGCLRTAVSNLMSEELSSLSPSELKNIWQRILPSLSELGMFHVIVLSTGFSEDQIRLVFDQSRAFNYAQPEQKLGALRGLEHTAYRLGYSQLAAEIHKELRDWNWNPTFSEPAIFKFPETLREHIRTLRVELLGEEAASKLDANANDFDCGGTFQGRTFRSVEQRMLLRDPHFEKLIAAPSEVSNETLAQKLDNAEQQILSGMTYAIALRAFLLSPTPARAERLAKTAVTLEEDLSWVEHDVGLVPFEHTELLRQAFSQVDEANRWKLAPARSALTKAQ